MTEGHDGLSDFVVGYSREDPSNRVSAVGSDRQYPCIAQVSRAVSFVEGTKQLLQRSATSILYSSFPLYASKAGSSAKLQ